MSLRDLLITAGGGAVVTIAILTAVGIFAREAILKFFESRLARRQARYEVGLDRIAKRRDLYDTESFKSAITVWEKLEKLERSASLLWQSATMENIQSCGLALTAAEEAADYLGPLITDEEREELHHAFGWLRRFLRGKGGLLFLRRQNAPQDEIDQQIAENRQGLSRALGIIRSARSWLRLRVEPDEID